MNIDSLYTSIQERLRATYPGRDLLFLVEDALHLALTPQLTLHAQESNKTLETVCAIWDFLFDHHATRKTLLVCIGGGIITDLGGFAASTYKRGMDYLNIPTTLLAMIDASTGGKTGFNYKGIKNSIGIIRQPIDTWIEPDFLTSLPAHQLLSGYAELIKTALLDSPNTYHQALTALEQNDSLLSTSLIEHIVTIKQHIVAQDPQENGLRKVLNLGHTIAHALEEYSLAQQPHSPLSHGYAVMYGMVAELYLSVTQLGLNREVLRSLTHTMITYYGRPQCACSDRKELIQWMYDDKKNEQSHAITFTLLRQIGEPVINQIIPEAQIQEALEYLFTL
ncbi:MAG: 3-dehydroquinate synthase [Paludibacteraceae bacterium]|nr:3-dehydroquinate synthase [Paludibacteraceae bacterium]